MPLVDPFNREITYLRISVTDRCNLRCTYCMPDHPLHAEREEVLSFEEIDRLVGVAVALGWKKVRLTGGEPLARRDFVHLVELLGRRKRGENGGPRLHQLVMTTNAVLLARQAHELHAAGLDRVNISLDTRIRERFQRITGQDKLEEVLAGIEAAVDAGLHPVKLNTVLIKGSTEDELFDFVEMARTRPLDIRFIEFMPFGGNGWSMAQVLPSAEIRAAIEARYPLTPVDPPRDGGPAQTFTASGWAGRVSFISPISDRAFCTRCNRVRLTSEGKLRGCLLNENEMDFRLAMRQGVDDEGLAELFRRAIGLKPEEHPYHHEIREGIAVGPVEGRGMHRIGG
jgi:cyclic pyranopterin phosphate synthase